MDRSFGDDTEASGPLAAVIPWVDGGPPGEGAARRDGGPPGEHTARRDGGPPGEGAARRDGGPPGEGAARADGATAGEHAASSGGATAGEHFTGRDPVEARLADALERVAHGATVTVPSRLFERGLTVVFTVILTNGFAASSYGLFVLAQRLQEYLSNFALGFGSGLSRFLPTASPDERDVFATFASLLLLGVAAVLGAAGYVLAPQIAAIADEGPQFELFVRIFAAGLPAATWLYTVVEILRGLEEVVPLNLAFRVAFPTLLLAVAGLGTYVFQDIVLVAIGVALVPGLIGLVVAVWLGRERGFELQVTDRGASALHGRYLRFTGPLFLVRFATTTQAYGFYVLIALFLSGVAGGVFVVGTILGSLVQLPLGGINQFIAPVFAALHEREHRDALRRLYQVTSRLVLIFVTGLAIPLVVYREAVMSLFGPTFVGYAWLLPGFVLGHYAASTMGSVAILLKMTDHQRAFLWINVGTTALLAAIAIPLTAMYGLPGLVASYVLMLAMNNALELAGLYYLEGLQPFTRLHAKPLVAAVPMVLVAVAGRAVLPGPTAPLLGTLLGVGAYAGTLAVLGFEREERRLVRSLLARYRGPITGSGTARTDSGSTRTGSRTARTGSGTARTGSGSARTGSRTARTGSGTARTGSGSARTGSETARAGLRALRTPVWVHRNSDRFLVVGGMIALVGGLVQVLLSRALVEVRLVEGLLAVGLVGPFAIIGGALWLVVGLVGSTNEAHLLRRALWALLFVATLLVLTLGALFFIL